MHTTPVFASLYFGLRKYKVISLTAKINNMLLPLLFSFLVICVVFGFCAYVIRRITAISDDYEGEPIKAEYNHSPLKMRAFCVEIAEAFVTTENATFEVNVYDIEQFCYDFTLATGLLIDATETDDPEVWRIKEKK